MPQVKTAGLLSLLVLAVTVSACSSTLTEVPEGGSATTARKLSTSLIPNPLIGSGAFTSYTPNNDGLEFWDNLSIDGTKCNVGYFANNDFGPVCSYEIAPALLSDEFKNSQFYGAFGGAKPTPFTFAAGSYTLKFMGGYRGYATEPIGYFTKSPSTQFTQIAAAVSSQVGGEVTFTVDQPWGFYINPLIPISGGDGGCGVAIMCSDDTKLQQFALFQKPGEYTYLLGVEDQGGVGVGVNPSGSGDRDYNDFFVRVEPNAPVANLDGRMTGGGSLDLPNQKKPLSVSLTIHCDLKLSNNIQINWGDNTWHLAKPITEAMCAYVRDPRPPAAPINVFSGVGYGRLNGVDGSKLEFTFIDNGEPNRGNDRVALKIYEPNSNNVYFTLALQDLKTGNIQAHYDQPHK